MKVQCELGLGEEPRKYCIVALLSSICMLFELYSNIIYSVQAA